MTDQPLSRLRLTLATLTPDDARPTPLCPECGQPGTVAAVRVLPSGLRVRQVEHDATDCAVTR